MARPRRDDRGEMIVVMTGLTAMLLGLAGVLVWFLGRPPQGDPVQQGQEAMLELAVEWRAQALAAGLSAEEAGTLDLCSTVADLETIVDCRLDPAGLTLVSATGEVWTAVLDDANPNCLTVRTSWQETLPARCAEPAGTQG